MAPVVLAHDVVGHGAAVVLVHGHPFDRTLWLPQLRSLRHEFRVVAPDLRGFGQSPTISGPAGMDELADDVWALLAQLEIDDVAVVGLSMGGLVAMEMAIARPERVWALGLVATTAQAVTEDERRQRLALADEIEAVGMQPLVQSMGPRLFGPTADPQEVDRILATMAATTPAGAAAALRGRAARPDYRDELRGLAMPSFVCTGGHDVWSTVQVTEELVGCLRRPRCLTLPEAGHLPNLECPALFNAELSSFLRRADEARERTHRP